MTGWLPPFAVVLAEVAYPLVGGATRAALVMVTVLAGYAMSIGHAATTRGVRPAVALALVGTCGGFGVEAVGVATGVPFGRYAYRDVLGPQLLGVPLAIPLAWTWMLWPAWLAAGRTLRPSPLADLDTSPLADRRLDPQRSPAQGVSRCATRRWRRIGLAGFALAAWDLFLDPQMVREGYWRWAHPVPSLPGVPGVPLTNYLGWLLAAVLLTALLDRAGGARVRVPGRDTPMTAFYLWTWASGGLAHVALLGLPGSACWGSFGMGVVAGPLAWTMARTRVRRPADVA